MRGLSIPANSLHNFVSLLIEILIDSSVHSPVGEDQIRQAAKLAAQSRGFDHGQIGIRLTDDATIHQVNRKHLQHDYSTDVISFAYQVAAPMIEGELIVSVDTAVTRAAELGWSAANELLLYTIHGTLHLTGMDDQQPIDRREMRACRRSNHDPELGITEVCRFGADAENAIVTASVAMVVYLSDRVSTQQHRWLGRRVAGSIRWQIAGSLLSVEKEPRPVRGRLGSPRRRHSRQ